ncbi:MAG: hypothetical protein M9942_11580 [Microthrixaceae bacterium]|nr:hypothetical protein [Microthrixaceae bacterium]
MTLFGDEVGRPVEPPVETSTAAARSVGGRVVAVLPDVPALDRVLHYLLPDGMEATVGSVVRVPLHGRRVRGWILAMDVDADPGLELREVTRVSGLALDHESIQLARWVAWRWVSRLATVLRNATPDRVVRAPSGVRARRADPTALPAGSGALHRAALDALSAGVHPSLLQVEPTADPAPVALAAASLGQALVVVPSASEAARITSLLGRGGATAARWPGATGAALAGHSIVGGHGAVLAPMPELAAVVVLDEHDPRLQNESSPTWHAREVAIERARRRRVPVLLVSPMPSLEARGACGEPRRAVPSSGSARAGWARTEVLDRRDADPREGLFSQRFVDAARSELSAGRHVVCVLNRTGRARLLACRSCGLVAACEACGAAVRVLEEDVLSCPRCGQSRPRVCLGCGGHAMKVLRPGVTRAREDLEALLREPVGLLTASEEDLRGQRVLIGTEAVLNRHPDSLGAPVGLVCMLEFDQELLAPRYRAGEDALWMLVRASRLVHGRGGRILVQTRQPDHEVLDAAVHADPARILDRERSRRELLGLPPAAAVAAVGGEAAEEWISRLGHPAGVELQGPRAGWWLVRAASHEHLAAAAGAVERPPGRLRLRVDPMALPG